MSSIRSLKPAQQPLGVIEDRLKMDYTMKQSHGDQIGGVVQTAWIAPVGADAFQHVVKALGHVGMPHQRAQLVARRLRIQAAREQHGAGKGLRRRQAAAFQVEFSGAARFMLAKLHSALTPLGSRT